MIDPAIESHYGTGYERSRLFRDGRPSLEFVRSMELLDRLLPAPPARLLDVGGGPGSYAAPLARRGYRVHLVDPLPLHVEQARQAAGSDPAAAFTAALGDARELAEPGGSQDAVVLFGPLYHLTEAVDRQRALGEARRVLRPGGRLLAMAVCRFASLLDGLYEGWLDDPAFRPIVEQDLASGQHRNPDPVGRPEFFTTAFFHTPAGLGGEIEQAGFTGVTVYGVEGPGWPLRREWADPQRREHILFAARAVETQPSLIGFSDHLIAAAAKPQQTQERPPGGMSIGVPDASPVGVIAAARRGEAAGDCGGGAEGTIDVVLAGTGRRRPFFAACGPRGCGVSVNA